MMHVARTRKNRVHARSWWESLRERSHLKHLDVDGRIIFKEAFKKWNVVDIDGINLTQDRDRWQALVNAVINFRYP
jgi:hypothetical protein